MKNLLKFLLPSSIALLAIKVVFENAINQIPPNNFDIYVLVLAVGAFLGIKDEK